MKPDLDRIAVEVAQVSPRMKDFVSVGPVQRAAYLETVNALLARLEQEGYVLVPKEPTDKMQAAGGELFGDEPRIPHQRSIYSAMLAAAKGETK